MKKILFILVAFFLINCSKDDDTTINYGKIEYKVFSEYQNDNISIGFMGLNGYYTRNKIVSPPYSFIIENYNYEYAKIEAWRPSLSSGFITVEIYLDNVLVASETVKESKYVANAGYNLYK